MVFHDLPDPLIVGRSGGFRVAIGGHGPPAIAEFSRPHQTQQGNRLPS
jgi:hypothetical protein